MSSTHSGVTSVSEAVDRLIAILNHLSSDAGENILQEMFREFRQLQAEWRVQLDSVSIKTNFDEVSARLAEHEKSLAGNAAKAAADGKGPNFQLQATKAAILGRVGEVIAENYPGEAAPEPPAAFQLPATAAQR